MLTRPNGLDDALLREKLRTNWSIDAETLAYLPVGFGSHHWSVHDARGTRWFVTVDVLAERRWFANEPNNDVFARLSDALTAAIDVQRDFVVAPIAPPARLNDKFSIACYPYVDGETFAPPAPRNLDAVRAILRDLHAVPPERTHARRDNFVLQCRDALEDALAAPGPDTGPYTSRMYALVLGAERQLRTRLEMYDRRAEEVAALPFVVTHGEPHWANTMLTTDGWKLIDWDTCLLAPAERDLWHLGDTGTHALDFYRLRWDLSDIAMYVQRLSAPHTGNADDEKSFRELEALLARYR